MSRRILTAIALAVLALAGCGKPIEARAARGFVELSDTGAYDFRAVAPEGVAVAARVVKLDEPTEVAFWERAVSLRMRELDGYALVEAKDVRAYDGSPGRELSFGHDEEGKPFVYRIRVFVIGDKLLVVEAGGSRDQMKAFASSVDWMLEQIRLR
jgi:hypothetical protein